MAVEHGQPDRGLVAEGDRQGLLRVGATGHRRIAVLLRQVSEDGAQRRDIFLDYLETGADPQHVRRVHDVLGGGAPVHVATGVAALFYELMHERQDRIADDVGLVAQEVEVERGGVGLGRDLLGRFGRDDTAARLGTRQRDLHFNVARDQGVVGKDLAHAWGAEGIAKQDGVENGGCRWDSRLSHGVPPVKTRTCYNVRTLTRGFMSGHLVKGPYASV